MQTALTYRTNRDLFSNYYLDVHLPETEAWDAVSDEELQAVYDDISALWEREKDTAPKRNESQLEEKFIRPMFRELGIPFEVEESTDRTQRRPDYGFFDTEAAARDAFDRREAGGDFYENAVAVADAKQWGRPLDTRGSDEHERDFENPSYQIHVYLQETPTRWAVLTDGKKWRLYYGPTSHRLDSYYEVDLPTILESGDLEAFKYFYLFFRHEAFLEDASGDCFLDDVYSESNVFARELGEDLQDNIYEAIKVLSEGFLQYPENDLDEDDLDLIHDSSLIYLYRLIFVLYAEAEGRELLDTSNEIYEESYSLNSLKQEVAEELDSGDPKYRDWQDNLQSRLDELFTLIDKGSKSRGIPEEDLYIPAYNGGLFRTDPDEDDSAEANFLDNHDVGDAYLAKVVELLTRSKNGNGGGKIFVDYSSLDVRHLGSIYEGLLEYQLNVADESLALDEGEYVSADEDDDVVVQEGEVYLTTGSGERKATGSYYTPEYVVEYIVENTLEPLVDDIRVDLAGRSARGEDRGFAEEFAERIFDLKILDPAMGSGHFLTSAIDYLAREIIDAQERQAAQQGIETVDENHDINWARRKVAQRCIYGVDLNPLAVELSKVALWLRTLAAEQPLAFLDHHLKAGNSLIGSDIEDVLGQNDDKSETGQLTLQQTFEHTRQQALEHVMERFTDLLSIDNETLADIKRMEEAYDDVREDELYQHLLAMANVHTAEDLGLDIPSDAYERMAEALRDDSWGDIVGQDWFKGAQAIADDEKFFHWELEFPVAFYGENGERKKTAGFDAVVGNPPYVGTSMISDQQKNYLENNFSSTTGRWDLYLLFTEKSLSYTQGLLSFIQPSMFMRRQYGEGLRNHLATHSSIVEIVDLSEIQVFEGATNYTCVFTLSPRVGSKDEFPVYTPRSEHISTLKTDEMDHYTLHNSELSSDPWGIIPPNVVQILDTIPEEFETLGDRTESISEGVHTGCNAAFFVNKEVAQHKELEEELLKPMLKGKDVKRYSDLQTELRCIYPYRSNGDVISENTLQEDYPNIWEHLEGHREQLEGRTYVLESGKEWYEIWCERNQSIYSNPKLLTPDIADGNQFSIDISDKPKYFNTKVKSIRLAGNQGIEDYYGLLGVLNSNLIEFIYRGISPPKRGGFRSYKPGFLSQLKVPSSGLRDVAEETKIIRNSEEKLSNLNLSLLDHLGNYTEGPTLPDIGLFQPTSSKILDATQEDSDKLRVGDVKTERDKFSVTVYATARYKPEEEEEFDTDQWGYIETDYKEAFTLADLTKMEAVLVEAFVAAAVEEGDGFAGFRDNATKTNSPIDRLKSITLPDIDDVADDLDRYIQTKERADELDEKIVNADQLIEEIVYDLYGLTDEEIEIVESAVQDD